MHANNNTNFLNKEDSERTFPYLEMKYMRYTEECNTTILKRDVIILWTERIMVAL